MAQGFPYQVLPWLFPKHGEQDDGPRLFFSLTPRTCEYADVHSTGGFANVLRVMDREGIMDHWVEQSNHILL